MIIPFLFEKPTNRPVVNFGARMQSRNARATSFSNIFISESRSSFLAPGGSGSGWVKCPEQRPSGALLPSNAFKRVWKQSAKGGMGGGAPSGVWGGAPTGVWWRSPKLRTCSEAASGVLGPQLHSWGEAAPPPPPGVWGPAIVN